MRHGRGVLLLARIDKLLDIGALDQAAGAARRGGPEEPELFRRAFDVALLTGTEDRACVTMRATTRSWPRPFRPASSALRGRATGTRRR